MRDNENQAQSISFNQEIQIREYIEMTYNEKHCITIGKNEEENYLLHVGDKKLTEPYKTLLVNEDTLFGLIASAIIYFEHYGVNIKEKVRELISSDSITYKFPFNNYEKD